MHGAALSTGTCATSPVERWTMRLRCRPAYLLLALACSGSAACASISDSCRKDASDCIRRCEKTTDQRGVTLRIGDWPTQLLQFADVTISPLPPVDTTPRIAIVIGSRPSVHVV